MNFEERYLKARAEMIEINKLIFSVGAPLGSDAYFRIRTIAAAYEREETNANPQEPKT